MGSEKYTNFMLVPESACMSAEAPLNVHVLVIVLVLVLTVEPLLYTLLHCRVLSGSEIRSFAPNSE